MAVADFGPFAQQGDQPAKISSMCTVFAESEATALVARGMAMLRRVAPTGAAAFSGGAARNPCMRGLIENELGAELRLPPYPHLSGAYGAVLLLQKRF